ncbi:hypothetical protein FPOAC1_012262 [Fusarium poae]|jgi:DNA-directed RNA polymerase beta' subunit|uniref:hypothetical protein n=1 Tax=Fusarium poae TaxID=36050 RepID=UPI001CE77E63|nr:hypothetical protein FPOAC1_012262 [Fusarium poae]KAG8667431.1 hypothetical protein FPOAC1_012262 [Fusarium poae]
MAFITFITFLEKMQSALKMSMADEIVEAELVQNKIAEAFEPRIPKYHKIQRHYIFSPNVNVKRFGCM